MEYLPYGNDSDFENDDDVTAPVAAQSQWIDVDDEKDDNDDENELMTSKEPTSTKKRDTACEDIPKAADLFAMVDVPKYLSPLNPTFEVSVKENKSLTDGSNSIPVVAGTGKKHEGTIKKRQNCAESKINPTLISSENPKEKRTADEKKEKDSLTVKDKVKRQRLSGQAGIGSDFKEWRSDEEMRLRQHFD